MLQKKKKRTKNEGGIQRSVEMEAFSGQRLHCMKMAMEWEKVGEKRASYDPQMAINLPDAESNSLRV